MIEGDGFPNDWATESEPLIKSPAQEDMDIRQGTCNYCGKAVQFIKNKPANHVCVDAKGFRRVSL